MFYLPAVDRISSFSYFNSSVLIFLLVSVPLCVFAKRNKNPRVSLRPFN